MNFQHVTNSARCSFVCISSPHSLSPLIHKIELQSCAKEQQTYYQVHCLHHSSQFFQFLQRIQYLRLKMPSFFFFSSFFLVPSYQWSLQTLKGTLNTFSAPQMVSKSNSTCLAKLRGHYISVFSASATYGKQHPQLHKAEPSCKHELEGYHNFSSSIFA